MRKNILLYIILISSFISFGYLYAINEKGPESEGNVISKTDIINFLYKDYLPLFKEDSSSPSKVKTKIEEMYVYRENKDSIIFQTIINICHYMQSKGKLTNCIELINRVYPYYKRELNKANNKDISYIVCRLQIMLGAAYEEIGLWKQSMDQYNEAMLITHKYEIKSLEASLLNNMGNIYFKQKDYDKALNLYNSAIEINIEQNNKSELFNNYNNIGGLFMDIGDYKKALDYSFLALQQIDRSKDPYSYYMMWLNVSIIYMQEEKYEVAWEYMEEGLKWMEENGYITDLGLNSLSAYNLWKKKGDIKKQKYYLDKAVAVSEKIDNKKFKVSMYEGLSGYYYTINDYKNAYKYLFLGQGLKDSINQLDNWKKLSDMELVYEAEKTTQEYKIISNELEIKSLMLQKQRITLIAVIMAFVVIISFIGYGYKIQKKTRLAREDLAEKQAELYKKEKEILIRNQNTLKNDLEIKSRELTSKVLRLVRSNEFIINITDELKQLLLEMNPKDISKKEHIRELMAKLKSQGNDSSDNEFKYYFEQVYQSFYDNLLASYPNLSTKDLRLCAFLRLGLSTKEIAAITFREIRSVDSSRNRLRKKMDIPNDTDLTEFFSKF